MAGLHQAVERLAEASQGMTRLQEQAGFKPGWGRRSEGRPVPPRHRRQGPTNEGPYGQRQKLNKPKLTPSTYWNEDPRNRWFDRSNIGKATIDGVETTCLLDNGSRVNLVTPEYVKKRKMDVGSIQDLNHYSGRIPLGGMGGNVQEPLGYVIL